LWGAREDGVEPFGEGIGLGNWMENVWKMGVRWRMGKLEERFAYSGI
jgi:hypothetical protein